MGFIPQKFLRLFLINFIFTSIILMFANFLAAEQENNTQFPLPKSGNSVKSSGYISEPGSYALWVDVASKSDSKVTAPKPDFQCALEAQMTVDIHSIPIARPLLLHHAADYYWGQTIQYSSNEFTLPKGKYIISVINRECSNSKFDGGMAYLYHYKPDNIPIIMIMKNSSYFLIFIGFIGMFILFIMSVTARISGKY